MPHVVDIRCPECGDKAQFEFAEVVRIRKREEVAFFQQNNAFEYRQFTDSCGHKWHAAIYYAGMHGGSVNAITTLPNGYEPDDWSHSKFLVRDHGTDMGSIFCGNCHLNRLHNLSWPGDAYFSIEHRGNVLWAFNQESAGDLYHFISSHERKVDAYKWSHFLMHIPTVFKTKAAREPIAKKLAKLLRPD
ncbi:hypothetical protein [Hahella sp. HN01]|uniref:hypothetical protein n=1 Tax=Hahella sp. HN01 TaxID=2847262 RepID=UPI001C1F13F0|nr:hypothetical protein [Hahella sp. HN01]MBU6953590.1 hypothetical protein [Hahella sp. HN01]